MTDDDKEYYKQKAKGGDLRISRNKPSGSNNKSGPGQLTTQGIPISLIEQEEREKRIAIEHMRRRIGEMVQKIPLMTGTFSSYFAIKQQ